MLGSDSIGNGLDTALLPESAPGVSSASPRIAQLDNAKAFLIYFVVVYHLAVVYTSADRPEAPVAYWSGFLVVLKPVVIPGWCLISGHLSRAAISQRHARGLAQVMLTYVLFQTLYYLNNWLSFRLNGFPFPALPVQVFQPQEQVVTWFLLALVLWRTLLPLVVQLRWPLTTSLLLAHAALFVDLGLNHQNLFSFLPYFVAGHLLPRSTWDLLARPGLRLGLAALFLGATAGMIAFSAYGGEAFQQLFLYSVVNYACFTGALPNDEHGCATLSQLGLRALFYAASLPLLLGFLCLLPTRRGVWTAPGYMSMYVYLLHPLVITNPLVMRSAFGTLSSLYGREVNVWSPATAGSAVAMLLPVAFVCTALLSTPPARMLFRLFVEPPIGWLFKDSGGATRARQSELRESQSAWVPPNVVVTSVTSVR